MEFDVEDWVFLKVPKSHYASHKGGHNKLDHRFYGPYLVLERIGELAYKLQLPSTTRIHNVFHVNLLKKYVSDPFHVLNLDDTILINQEEFQMEPEQVL